MTEKFDRGGGGGSGNTHGGGSGGPFDMLGRRCQWRGGCNLPGQQWHDHSIQLPDYRLYCDLHYEMVSKEEWEKFEEYMRKREREKEDKILAQAEEIKRKRELEK